MREGFSLEFRFNTRWGWAMMHMVIEQTIKYPMRLIFDPLTKNFVVSEHRSLMFDRGFTKPYGWIKESGTPPQEHWDSILMTEKEYELGDEVEIKIIGLFKRTDFDHKYIAVEIDRDIEDYDELSVEEKEELRRLYPKVRPGEGWYGKEEAVYCMNHNKKAL